MVSVRELDEFDLRVLGVVFLEVGEELLVIACVDSGRDAIGPFGEQ